MVHDYDGDWQFLCGGSNHFSADDIVILCGDCLFKSDPPLKGIQLLDKGYSAERESGDSQSWDVTPVPHEEMEGEVQQANTTTFLQKIITKLKMFF